MEKNFRIHTNVGQDTVLSVDMRQDFDFLEVLSLKLRQSDLYRLHTSNYGVIVGRVLANDAFGIPNAKVSVFVERDTDDAVDIANIYPYASVTGKDGNGIRYNLLPDYSHDDCYRVVGTFPNKNYLLDNDVQIEVYEKYWKFTTVTNNVGDYMIFGIPSGYQTIHCDLDLSDIGILSQKPRDFEYKGYNETQFDNANQFKSSTNLNNLVQLFSQDTAVDVHPFWGDLESNIAAITRHDIQIQYKFEPTCIFMGSIISDNDSNSIGHTCTPGRKNGRNDQIVAGEGTIEMIRVTQDGLIEDYQIQGNKLIDSDGVWCYQIPMNLDYIGMDEYGNIVPTDNPQNGIPTRARVRFRISKLESGEEGFSRHTAKYLVPNNPEFNDGLMTPFIDDGKHYEKMYAFGSSTPKDCFRDLYWNNVYSVKNYIPKIQRSGRASSIHYSSLKAANYAGDKNELPFNKLFINVPFTYMIICILFQIILKIVELLNKIVVFLMWMKYNLCIPLGFTKICPLKPIIKQISCINLSAGLADGNTAYFPGCNCKGSAACKHTPCPKDMEDGNCVKSSESQELEDKIQQNLAIEHNVVSLDLQNDWINGSLYMPLWHWKRRRKKTFLFGLIRRKAKNSFCSCERKFKGLKTYLTCDFGYSSQDLEVDNGTDWAKEMKWHKNRKAKVGFKNGVIKPVENKDGLTVYYYSSANPSDKNAIEMDMPSDYINGFYAVRLYATDIILLGSMNPNDLNGVPQLFENLPSTSSNVPEIATIVETLDDKDDTTQSDAASSEESGSTVITGMDWGYKGKKQNPMYGTGLFIDLSCTAAKTLEKSCVNVERLSEYGVVQDMSYSMPYNKDNNGIQYGDIYPDGFINKYEIEDFDHRAAFATLNHIGFIPQDTLDSSHVKTQIIDRRTGYYIPRFKYMYPTNFDGRLNNSMKEYTKKFPQVSEDLRDTTYVQYRLGENRHFYISSNPLHMPLYNNSYFFYFGVNKGNTAIDKFREKFWSQCFKDEKYPFTVDIESQGRPYCPSIYSLNVDKYAYIRVKLEDILVEYTYTLVDSNGDIVIKEGNMTSRDFVIGGQINNGNITLNENGVVQPQGNGVIIYPQAGYYLRNGVYTLIITDVNGKSVTERIYLEVPKVGLITEVVPLSTRFLNPTDTMIPYICNDEYEFFGVYKILGVSIDGTNLYKGDVRLASKTLSDDKATLVFDVIANNKSKHGGNIEAKIRVIISVAKSETQEHSTYDSEIRECLCTHTSKKHHFKEELVKTMATVGNPYWVSDAYYQDSFSVFFYEPGDYNVHVVEYCGTSLLENTQPPLEDNYTDIPLNIPNGENFNVYLSGMPIRFMLGGVTDTQKLETSSSSKLYAGKAAATSPLDPHLIGWYYLDDEMAYQFRTQQNQVVPPNQDMWEDFIDIWGNSLQTAMAKKTAILFKFNSMFSLANASYELNEFELTATGGRQPILYRSVVPDYASSILYNNMEAKKYSDVPYLLSIDRTATVLESHPNVVTPYYPNTNTSYQDIERGDSHPVFNKLYGTHYSYVGNYFAAFTKNGGYTSDGSKLAEKGYLGVQRVPNITSVSPRNNIEPLPLSKTDSNTDIVRYYKYVHTQGTQSLKNDLKGRKLNPYLRALTVDRRFDFDLLIMGPVVSKSFVLNETDNKTWKGARLSGTTLNGIELSYDEDYNVISALTPSNQSDKTTRNFTDIYRLSYTYATRNGFAYKNLPSPRAFGAKELATTENLSPAKMLDDEGNIVSGIGKSGFCVWDTDHKDARFGARHIIERYYSSSFGDIDIRNFYWSKFNEERLSYQLNDEKFQNNTPLAHCIRAYSGSDLHVFRHEDYEDKGYNDSFNRLTYRTSYPTKRVIDIGGFNPRSSYEFSTSQCSFEMMPYIDDMTQELLCQAVEGEETSFRVDFQTPVEFVNPNPDNEDFYNTSYKNEIDSVLRDDADYSCQKITIRTNKNGNTENRTHMSTYAKFTSSSMKTYFTVNGQTNDDFSIKMKRPRVLKVLPYEKDINVRYKYYDMLADQTLNGNVTVKISDGLTALKTAKNYSSTNPTDSFTVEKILSDLQYGTVKVYNSPSGAKFRSMKSSSNPSVKYEYLSSSSSVPLYSDNGDYSNTIFVNEVPSLFGVPIDTKVPSVAVVMVEKEFESFGGDGLVKGLRTFEFSDLLDLRYIEIRSITADYEIGQITRTDDDAKTYKDKLYYTYVQRRNINSPLEEGEEPPSGGEEGDTGTTGEPEIIAVQYVGFELQFTDGPNGSNQSFKDWENMSFSLKVSNKFYANAISVTPIRAPYYMLATTDVKNADALASLYESIGDAKSSVEAMVNEENRTVTKTIYVAEPKYNYSVNATSYEVIHTETNPTSDTNLYTFIGAVEYTITSTLNDDGTITTNESDIINAWCICEDSQSLDSNAFRLVLDGNKNPRQKGGYCINYQKVVSNGVASPAFEGENWTHGIRLSFMLDYENGIFSTISGSDNKLSMKLYAKTPSSFTYMVPFSLVIDKQEYIPELGEEESEGPKCATITHIVK